MEVTTMDNELKEYLDKWLNQIDKRFDRIENETDIIKELTKNQMMKLKSISNYLEDLINKIDTYNYVQ